MVTWIDGRLSASGAMVSVADHGFTVGDGVFETCELVGGVPFALTRHLRRLRAGATTLGLTVPDDDVVRGAVGEVVAAFDGGPRGRLRITVTSGAGALGPGRPAGAATLVVAAGPVGPAAHGVRVLRSHWLRNERSAVAGVKTTSYAENVVALDWAAARGAQEVVLANTQGELCEGAASNVFIERGGELVTPALSTGCLAGVTRELLLEWGRQEGLPVRDAAAGELPFPVLEEVVAGTSGLALTASIRNVVAVTNLDGTDVEPGPLTVAARELFLDRMQGDLDP